jgi:hypothetical protein
VNTPTREYVELCTDQINAAVAGGDSALVLYTIGRIRVEHPDLADALTGELIGQGLDNLTAGAGR